MWASLGSDPLLGTDFTMRSSPVDGDLSLGVERARLTVPSEESATRLMIT